jgi:hypothetical protein
MLQNLYLVTGIHGGIGCDFLKKSGFDMTGTGKTARRFPPPGRRTRGVP